MFFMSEKKKIREIREVKPNVKEIRKINEKKIVEHRKNIENEIDPVEFEEESEPEAASPLIISEVVGSDNVDVSDFQARRTTTQRENRSTESFYEGRASNAENDSSYVPLDQNPTSVMRKLSRERELLGERRLIHDSEKLNPQSQTIREDESRERKYATDREREKSKRRYPWSR